MVKLTMTTDKVNIWQSASLEEGMAEFCNVCSFKFNLDLILEFGSDSRRGTGRVL